MAKSRKPAPKQVHEYFVEKLGRHPDIDTWNQVDIPVESTCGDDCVAAIDAAAELIRHARAGGTRACLAGIDTIRLTASEICGVYICG